MTLEPWPSEASARQSPVSRGRGRRHRWSGPVGRGARLGGVLPALVLIGAVIGVSIVQAIVVSFSDWRGVGAIEFIGLDNYAEVLTDPATFDSLWTTLLYSIASAGGIVVVATLLAAAASAQVPGSGWYRVIWFLPGIAPGAAVAIFWATAFQPQVGALNVIARFFGFDGGSALLADPATALVPIIVVTIWAGVGFAFLLILGAMQQIPDTVYEAARIDGATPRQQFFSITVPLARPVIAITAMLEFIWAFNISGFTIVWAMTRGGPGRSTTTLPVEVYERAFMFADFGPAAALAVVGSLALTVVGLLGIRASRSGQ